tara:strand:- start:151 stop:459 length:309 start_codon:yes stop_codon:yes gene_type:complete
MARSYESGATPTTVTGSDQAALATKGAYFGISVRETGGSNTATAILYDNDSAASGTIIDEFTVAAGGTLSHWFGPGGVSLANGIYIDVSGSGALSGSIYHLS